VSISTITDPSVQQEIRRLQEKVERLSNQISTVIRDVGVVTAHSNLTKLSYAASGHTGFASSASVTTHTGDATIHFTSATMLAAVLAAVPVRQDSAPATDGTAGYFWLKTGTNPERIYGLVNDSGGTPVWAQMIKGPV